MPLTVGMVAGEPSGDLLGAAIIQALRQYYPDLQVTGVAGPRMQTAGATTLFPMEKLSVMGFSEVLLRAWELLQLRAQVKNYFLQYPPDVFIGIDSPDFNLPIEAALKKTGIKTVHCHSPTIWAWRKNRIFTIAKAVNLMLVLFPFEQACYEEQHIPVAYIGHPLADILPLAAKDMAAARQSLHLFEQQRIIALLPGSRQGEIKHIGPVLLRTAEIFLERYPDTLFISPMINQDRLLQFKQQWQALAPALPLMLIEGQAHTAMAAADVVALASGTAALEAMLLKRPMVVVYRGSALSYWIARQLVTIQRFSLPNILAGQCLVPEFIQHDAAPEKIANALCEYITASARIADLQQQFQQIHRQLRCQAGERAAAAIARLLAANQN